MIRPLLTLRNLLVLAFIMMALVACSATSPQNTPEATPPLTNTPQPPPAVESASTPVVETGGADPAPSTPLDVQLSMNKAPKVNEEVEVILEVLAYADAPGTTAQIELPPGAQLTRGELTWEGEVKVGSPALLTIGVIFTTEGEYSVRGSALRVVDENMTWGDEDFIYLTVKSDAGSFGYESGGNPEVIASPAP